MAAEEAKPGTQGPEARKALERFVVENDDLLELESRIGKFNIFDALGIARAEIRHSNFLAFILDPAESHGQRQLFLKAVLKDLLKKAPAKLRSLSSIDLDGTDLRGVEVKREWKNLDLLITCKEPRFAVVIENKVGSQDHSNQLNRYSQTMKQCYPDLKPLYVYLTPDGDDPSEETEETWLAYRYEDLYGVLKRLRDTHQTAIGDDVLVFLDHYLNLLGTRFMNDKELDELCERIYKNHRKALDLIWERVGSPASGVLAEAVTVLEEDHRWYVAWQPNHLVDFIPATWRGWLPPIGLDYEDDPCIWIVFRFQLRDGKLAFFAQVQRMADVALRKKIAELLIAEAPRFGFKRKQGEKVSDKWTRISGSEYVLEWGEDDEPEPVKIRESVKKKLDELYPRLEKLALVLKPLCKLPGSAT